MIMIFCFTCQLSSSKAEMDHQTNSIVLSTQPNSDLNTPEEISCIAQNNQTAQYTITIGSNIFRSQLIIYDAFKDTQIHLYPIIGSSVSDALNYFIASYEIIFLDTHLIQQGVVGQLLSTIYNLNECIKNGTITYETFQYIKPSVNINPNCKVIATGNVEYNFYVNSVNLIKEIILEVDFQFNNLSIKTADCKVGSEEEKAKCIEQSKYISGTNFILAELQINIPKTIVSDNIYIDNYGIAQTISETYQFMLVFYFAISQRLTTEDCTKENFLSFNKQSIFITQKINKFCDLEAYPLQEFWITASELEDNSGRKFQIQFYTDQPFNVTKHIDCKTWEISQYSSLNQCQKALNGASNFLPNASSSIAYKLYNINNNYLGTYRFSSKIIPGGEASLTVEETQICVNLLKNLTSLRTFANIDLKISSSFSRFQAGQIDFHIDNNFIFPSLDQIYCFSVNQQQVDQLNRLSFLAIFGSVEVAGSLLQIIDMQTFVPFDEFYEGYICLFGSLGIVLIWVAFKLKMERKLQKK